jgi:hypothetical protein
MLCLAAKHSRPRRTEWGAATTQRSDQPAAGGGCRLHAGTRRIRQQLVGDRAEIRIEVAA